MEQVYAFVRHNFSEQKSEKMPDLFIGCDERSVKSEAEKAKDIYGGEVVEVKNKHIDLSIKEHYGFVFAQRGVPLEVFYGVEHESRPGTFFANISII